jgi:hypothetical protein
VRRQRSTNFTECFSDSAKNTAISFWLVAICCMLALSARRAIHTVIDMLLEVSRCVLQRPCHAKT